MCQIPPCVQVTWEPSGQSTSVSVGGASTMSVFGGLYVSTYNQSTWAPPVQSTRDAMGEPG